jgi:hypothetical protein
MKKRYLGDPPPGKRRAKRWQNDEKTLAGTGSAWADGGVLPGLHWGCFGARGAGGGRGGDQASDQNAFWRAFGAWGGPFGALKRRALGRAGRLGSKASREAPEVVGGRRDGAFLATVQDGQFGLTRPPANRSKRRRGRSPMGSSVQQTRGAAIAAGVFWLGQGHPATPWRWP